MSSCEYVEFILKYASKIQSYGCYVNNDWVSRLEKIQRLLFSEKVDEKVRVEIQKRLDSQISEFVTQNLHDISSKLKNVSSDLGWLRVPQEVQPDPVPPGKYVAVSGGADKSIYLGFSEIYREAIRVASKHPSKEQIVPNILSLYYKLWYLFVPDDKKEVVKSNIDFLFDEIRACSGAEYSQASNPFDAVPGLGEMFASFSKQDPSKLMEMATGLLGMLPKGGEGFDPSVVKGLLGE